MTPLFAVFWVVGVLPLRVKKLAATPVNVYPVTGTTVTWAVYVVKGAKVVGEPDQVMVVVYWPLLVVDVCGVAPATGAVITAFALVIGARGQVVVPVNVVPAKVTNRAPYPPGSALVKHEVVGFSSSKGALKSAFTFESVDVEKVTVGVYVEAL